MCCSSYYQDSVYNCEYVNLNGNHYLCRTCHSVSTTAGGAENLLPQSAVTFIPPKEGFHCVVLSQSAHSNVHPEKSKIGILKAE